MKPKRGPELRAPDEAPAEVIVRELFERGIGGAIGRSGRLGQPGPAGQQQQEPNESHWELEHGWSGNSYFGLDRIGDITLLMGQVVKVLNFGNARYFVAAVPDLRIELY